MQMKKFQIHSVIMPLILVNVIFFALQFILGAHFTDSFLLASEDIFSRPWILVSYMFLHGNPTHLLFNMWALFIFGPLLEQRIGPKRFLLLYFGSGIIAGILSSFFYSRALGASGAIMGMLGTLIILMPDLQILLFLIIPMPLWIAGIIFALIDLLGVVYPSGVGNIAHLVGLGIGLLYGLYLKKENKKFHKKFSAKKHLDKEDINDYLKTGRI